MTKVWHMSASILGSIGPLSCRDTNSFGRLFLQTSMFDNSVYEHVCHMLKRGWKYLSQGPTGVCAPHFVRG